MKRQLVQLHAATSAGVFVAHYSDLGLTELDFPKVEREKATNYAIRHSSWSIPRGGSSSRRLQNKIVRWHRTTTAALKSILAGRRARALPPLDWSDKTEFQQSVWREMLKLGPGQTRSYAEIAQAIGKPKALRAVGGACGANPIPVLVPCHRVLAAHMKIGGFSGGLEWKRKLLEQEGLAL